MKVVNLILILAFLSLSYNRKCEGLATKASECNDAEFDTSEYYRCYYIDSEAEKDSSEFKIKFCSPVTKSDYYNITALINEATKQVRQKTDIDVKV